MFKIENRKDHAEVFIYGEIETAAQAEWLGIQLASLENEFDNCVVRVNTVGGDVITGFAMWELLSSAKMNVTFMVDGIAASMGSVLVQVPGTKVYMGKYAKMMIHRVACSASGSVEEIREAADMTEKWEADIIDVISKRTGLTANQVKKKWFDGKDHWLTAQEALDAGLIDGIKEVDIDYGELPQTTNTAEIYQYYNNILNKEEMKFENKAEFCNVLGIADNSSDEAVLSAALKAVKQNATLTASVTGLTQERDALKAKVTEFEKSEKEKQQTEIKNILDKAVADKKMTNQVRKHYEGLFAKDFESTKAIVESLPSVQNVSKFITNQQNADERAKWTFKDWQKNDPKGLQAMKVEDNERYKALFNAAYSK